MNKVLGRCVWLVLIAGCSAQENGREEGALGSVSEAATGCVVPVANLVVRASTTLCPGTYQLPDPEGDGAIQIKANQVTLTLSGVTLRGAGTGYGITATNVNGVTIKSSPTNRGHVEGYHSAILIEGGASHVITENVLSFNARRPLTHDDRDFLDVWAEFPGQLAANQIGNGLVLVNVNGATVTNNQARFQQNGIGLFGSSNVTLRGNDCSDNQGWGIHLTRSSNNTVVQNRADNVNLAASSFCHDVQADACDTSGILVIKASNGNLVQNNSFKNGGDGIFSAARQGDIQHGADHNRYVGNDVSFAKHLGVEATFADDILVENNTILSAGRSGIWLGGSRNSTVRGNTIVGSGWSGIENEGTQNFVIENNRIENSAENGIFLRDLASLGFPSKSQAILRNTIRGNGQFGIKAVDTQSINATGNTISDNGKGSVHLGLDHESRLTGPLAFHENRLLDATEACQGVDVACSCRTFDGDASGCAGAGGCEYFACSNRCEPLGTSSCDAGCGGCTDSCHDHDGNVEACDADGPCAYYFCSERCYPEGTPLEEACQCQAHDGNPEGCNAAPGCEYYSCSGRCLFDGTPLCHAGCCESSTVECPIDGVTSVTSNYWGTTDPSVIDASICGADLAFVPFKTAP